VRFGFGGISCQRYPGDPRSDVELYEQAVALAEAAEECGPDSVWVAEHPRGT
jgi:alkanesulfonate monooxygenase SsuD/methylene tetrahydromethanopterin reductase-like flavin-dependent oxidoreductase (luciferase family)